MTGNNRQPPEWNEPAEAQPEHVETRVASGTVRFRQGPDRATASLRLGTVLLIALLLAAAGYIAWSPAGAGDVSESADPGTTPDASIDLATSSLAAVSLEPTRTTEGSTPDPPSSEPGGTDSPGEEPEWTPRIWSFDPNAWFEASVVLTDSCLLSTDGWEVPHAQVMFQITWDGEVPLALIDNRTDGGAEGGYGGDIETSGTYGLGVIATTAEPHVLTMRFYADTEEVGTGTIVKEIDTPFEVDPKNLCYPGSPEPDPTDEP